MSKNYNRKDMNLSNHIRKSIDLGKTKSVDMSSQIEKTLKSHRTYNESQEEVKAQSVYSNMSFKPKSNVHMGSSRSIYNSEKIKDQTVSKSKRSLDIDTTGNYSVMSYREVVRRNKNSVDLGGEKSKTIQIESRKPQTRVKGQTLNGRKMMKLRKPVEIKYYHTLSLPYIDMMTVTEHTSYKHMASFIKPSIQILTDFKEVSRILSKSLKSPSHKCLTNSIKFPTKDVSHSSPRTNPLPNKLQHINIPKLVSSSRSKSAIDYSSSSVSTPKFTTSKPKETLHANSLSQPRLHTSYRSSSSVISQRRGTPLKKTVTNPIKTCKTPKVLEKSYIDIIEIKSSKIDKFDMSVQTSWDEFQIDSRNTIVEDPEEDQVSPVLDNKKLKEIHNGSNLSLPVESAKCTAIETGELKESIQKEDKSEELKKKHVKELCVISSPSKNIQEASTKEPHSVNAERKEMMSFEEFMKVIPSFPDNIHSSFISQPDKSIESVYNLQDSPISAIKSPLSSNSIQSDIKLNYESRAQKLHKRNLAAIKIQSTYRAWKSQKFSISNLPKNSQLNLIDFTSLNHRLCHLISNNKLSRAIKIWKLTVDIRKAEVYKKFLSLCAVMIQKYWRGYRTRKNQLGQKLKLKNCLKKYIKGWKVRQIMKTHEIVNLKKQISDLENLIVDLKKSNQNQITLDLIEKLTGQVRSIKSKLGEEVYYLYTTATWTSSKHTYDRKPIIKKIGFQKGQLNEQLFDEINENRYESPRVKFSNFLKRNKESYDPLKSIKNTSRTQTPQPKMRFDEELTQIHEVTYDEIQPIELKAERKPYAFLKRKTQMIKPKKINWQANRKIDCWGSPRSKSTKRSYRHTQSLLIDDRDNSRVMITPNNISFPASKTQYLAQLSDISTYQDLTIAFEEIEKECQRSEDLFDTSINSIH